MVRVLGLARRTRLTPGGAADFGWFAYAPLNDKIHSPGVGSDLWILGLTLGGLGTILGGVNFITTVFTMRAPGMTMFRMPIFSWNIFVTSLLVLLAFPVLAAAPLALEVDRAFGAQIFNPANGGPILWQPPRPRRWSRPRSSAAGHRPPAPPS